MLRTAIRVAATIVVAAALAAGGFTVGVVNAAHSGAAVVALNPQPEPPG
jgi:hypothetical protein